MSNYIIIIAVVTSCVLTIFLLYVGLEVPPTLHLLKHHNFIVRMATDYYDIGLELGIDNNQLRNIRDDLRFPGPVEKCREMLAVWLGNDTSATWEKLCKALETTHQKVLARDIRQKICSM